MVGTLKRPQWRRNLINTNWERYLADLAKSLTDFFKAIDDISKLEVAAKMLRNEMLNAYQKNCPLRKLRLRGHVRWWNKNLDFLRTRTRNLLKKARKHNDPLCWQQYNRKRD